ITFQTSFKACHPPTNTLPKNPKFPELPGKPLKTRVISGFPVFKCSITMRHLCSMQSAHAEYGARSTIKKLTQEKGKPMRKADKENPPYAN
ncbi:hypothetical protein, partial [Alcaligenes nematophilus]|uniref:hypothetical protein n=1 Tax=Alcaligenes nematophilus TaxID=2994643 RepID=UPI0028DA0BA4